jgi:soluble lytic murein transglycosylase
MKRHALTAAVAALCMTSTALASSETLPARPVPGALSRPATLPQILDASDRTAYRAIFAAIRAGDWAGATAALDAMPAGLLTPLARAELYLAKGSPKVELTPLLSLVEAAPELPQAAQLARLAVMRGAEQQPYFVQARALASLPGAPRRRAARTNASDAAAASLSAQVLPLIREDRPADAEMLLIAAGDSLTAEARTEWQQRIAWSYYLTGDDAAVRRLTGDARRGVGEWTVQADWLAGLAAWRQRDCKAAGDAFSTVAARARETEMMAAGLFWGARADMSCGRPDRIQAKLRTAARLPETFYGLLANGLLGTAAPALAHGNSFTEADWSRLSSKSNVRIAAALVEIGETGLADIMLRHQARIGAAEDHPSLLHLASRLELPAAQIWLAQNGPAGAVMPVSARYPSPSWTPQGGWRVDKSLILAHCLQESQFRTEAQSGAGARGLMQIMPGTAELIARKKGEPLATSLTDPRTNMEYGQSYLEQLRDFSATGGLLPKVIAAYNAGPGSVQKWNASPRDRGDPLLFIESIPFSETRSYVAIVLRNYWMYQQQSGQKTDSLKALAQGLWPRFPGLPGRTAVRIDHLSRTASAN